MLSFVETDLSNAGGREHPELYIVPENRSVDVNQPVHEHILIEENYFHWPRFF